MELTASTLEALAARPELAAEFPFLRALTRPPRSGGCGGCGAAAAGANWKVVAAAVFQLPPARRAVFKSLAGVDVVSRRVVRAGRVMTESF